MGAGASFPAPLYQRWLQELSRKTPNLQIDYQSVGSGAGIERFTQGLVQFSARDVAMTDQRNCPSSKRGFLAANDSKEHCFSLQSSRGGESETVSEDLCRYCSR
ncbi:MAG: substrate-binding domain-containing protein [Limnoraphis robusta]